ncbi:MAG TPA: A/G-specific adenine glycosylase [Tenuifilaceae bacterium]|nr:A/G-specific adenine glycosylase [Tenuifilaceae bacterium]
MEFKNILNKWYRHNRRELPWRDNQNPYSIWVSEVILQQTRVVQGIGFYNRFLQSFPTVYDLAEADEDKILKVWQGLGYYSRARNLQKAAKIIVEEHNGQLPDTFDELIKLPGIGHYTAGAIASFAFKEAVPAMDGNVYRVLSRIYGVFASPQTASGKQEFYTLVMEIIDKESPHLFNQALLDFGALQCLPRKPKCSDCPFSNFCYAYRNNLTHCLPQRGKKLVPKDRFFTYILIRYGGVTFIEKRGEGDIWRALYQFPLIETDALLDEDQVVMHPKWKKTFGNKELKIVYISPVVKHLLSHQTLHSRFVVVELNGITKTLKNSYRPIETESVFEYSVPRLIDNFLASEPAEKYFLNPPKADSR